jgi:hypothetical protein
MRMRRRALSSLTTALTVLACAPSPVPCPACPACAAATSASASAAPAPSSSAAPSASATPSAGAAPPTPHADDVYCRPADDPAVLGAWRATPAEIRAALGKAHFVCAPEGWLLTAVDDCMARLGRVDVVVRFGVLDGDRATPTSCDVTIGTVEWNGRRWVTLDNSIREQATFFGYITSVEMTARGPILSTQGCEVQNGKLAGASHPLVPAGWKTFPPEVQQRLCR